MAKKKNSDYAFQVINFMGVRLVLRPFDRRESSVYPQPNFANSGMALTGRLEDGETIDQFLKRRGEFPR